jgi:DNA-binding CsgD family transcriptional regulator
VTVLSPRQMEVVANLASGLTPAQIAAHHALSLHTVRTHIKAAETALDLNTIGALVAWWWGYRYGRLEAAARRVVDTPYEQGIPELASRLRVLAETLDG